MFSIGELLMLTLISFHIDVTEVKHFVFCACHREIFTIIEYVIINITFTTAATYCSQLYLCFAFLK